MLEVFPREVITIVAKPPPEAPEAGIESKTYSAIFGMTYWANPWDFALTTGIKLSWT